jgi:hypothetical protein
MEVVPNICIKIMHIIFFRSFIKALQENTYIIPKPPSWLQESHHLQVMKGIAMIRVICPDHTPMQFLKNRRISPDAGRENMRGNQGGR